MLFSFQDLVSLIKISRFSFLIVGFIIYSFGYLISFSEFDFFRFFIFYLPIFFSQLSVSYSNDFFDYLSDKNGKKTLISGGSGILQKKPYLLSTTKKIAIFLIFVSVIISLFIQLLLNPPIYFILVVFAANILGWYYSARPFKLSHNYLGELTMFVVVGFLVPIVGSIASINSISINLILLTPTMLFYSLLFSVSVQIPDFKSDKISKKYNITSKKGILFSQKFSFLLTLFSTIYLLILIQFFPVLIFVFIFSIIPLSVTLISLFIKNKKMDFLKSFLNLNSIFLYAIFCCIFILLV